MRCNSQESDVMGVLCRYHMVVQVSVNVGNVLTVICAMFWVVRFVGPHKRCVSSEGEERLL